MEDRMDKYCIECGKKTVLHHNLDLCYYCYEEMFKTPLKVEEEPDFELKHEVAKVSATGNIVTTSDSKLVYTTDMWQFKYPKRYKFDKDARVKDYEKLVEFILDNMYVDEYSKGFEKVSYMFKEVDKQW